jgi:hypothetical protein
MTKAGTRPVRPIQSEFVEPVKAVTPILSIQGEQQKKSAQPHLRMDQDLVEEIVADLPEECAECRAGHHRFPVIRPRDGIQFAGRSASGMPLQRLRCLGCNLVDKIVVWSTTDGIRWNPERTYLDYSVRGDRGEKYLLDQKGQGRMAPRQVQSALMTQGLQGLTLAAILKAAETGAVLKGRPKRRTRKAS